MIRFADLQDFVEIDLASQEDAKLPSRGDAYLTIQVFSKGFSGHNDLWVSAASLRNFCAALVALERTRRGEAVIESMVSDEMKLAIRSLDAAGHMAIKGMTGYQVRRGTVTHWHAVHFGIGFDTSQLGAAVAEDWVQRNASQHPG